MCRCVWTRAQTRDATIECPISSLDKRRGLVCNLASGTSTMCDERERESTEHRYSGGDHDHGRLRQTRRRAAAETRLALASSSIILCMDFIAQIQRAFSAKRGARRRCDEIEVSVWIGRRWARIFPIRRRAMSTVCLDADGRAAHATFKRDIGAWHRIGARK